MRGTRNEIMYEPGMRRSERSVGRWGEWREMRQKQITDRVSWCSGGGSLQSKYNTHTLPSLCNSAIAAASFKNFAHPTYRLLWNIGRWVALNFACPPDSSGSPVLSMGEYGGFCGNGPCLSRQSMLCRRRPSSLCTAIGPRHPRTGSLSHTRATLLDVDDEHRIIRFQLRKWDSHHIVYMVHADFGVVLQPWRWADKQGPGKALSRPRAFGNSDWIQHLPRLSPLQRVA